MNDIGELERIIDQLEYALVGLYKHRDELQAKLDEEESEDKKEGPEENETIKGSTQETTSKASTSC